MLVQDMAYPKKLEGLVLRAGLSSDHSKARPHAPYNADVAQLLYKVPSNPMALAAKGSNGRLTHHAT